MEIEGSGQSVREYLSTIVLAGRFPKIRTKVTYQRSRSATVVLLGRLSTTQRPTKVSCGEFTARVTFEESY